MRVLITGADGQLGRDAAEIFAAAGHAVFAAGREQLDITDQIQCDTVTSGFKPDVILHCAAYTAVDAAEQDEDGAYFINADGTRNMAVAAEKCGAKLIYISTDYVFDGESELPYREYDSPSPRSVYGKSKLAGEMLVQSLTSRFFIVRTSWVYGQHGQNFVGTIRRLAQEKPVIQVVNDQTGAPTYTVDLSRFLLALAQTEKYGIYHASNTGACSWYEFAEAILQEEAAITGKAAAAKLVPCTTDEFPRPAPRPRSSILDHMAIRNSGLTDLRPWREALREFLFEMYKP